MSTLVLQPRQDSFTFKQGPMTVKELQDEMQKMQKFQNDKINDLVRQLNAAKLTSNE